MRACRRCGSSLEGLHGQRLTCSDYCKFWEQVEIRGLDECWEWKGVRVPDGYGNFTPRRKQCHRSHRKAWEFAFGKIPDSKNVLHECDNPPCCNPVHLFLGTQKRNIDDMYKKGRNQNPRGVKHGNAILNDELVKELRTFRSTTGFGYGKIAKHFNLGLNAVRFAVNKTTWKHVD